MPTIFEAPTDELVRMANKLIDTRFTHLSSKRVEFAFVYECDSNGLISAPMAKGKEIWGRASLISGKNAWLAASAEQREFVRREPDKFFLVEIVKPIWEKFKDKPQVREALLHHELMHCDVDLDSGKLSIRPHDVEEFNATLRQYGLWKADLETFMQAGAEQMSLLQMMEASAANDSEMFDRVEVEIGGKTQLVSRAEVIAWWRQLELQREDARQLAATVERSKKRAAKLKAEGVTFEFKSKVVEV